MLVNPDVALLVDLAETVEVKLTDQGLKSVVTKESGKRFSLKLLNIRPNDKGISLACPLKMRARSMVLDESDPVDSDS